MAVTLQQMMEEEFAALKELRAGDSIIARCQLGFTTAGTHSEQSRILVDLDQTQTYIQGTSESAQRGFCRFTIAHEMGHVIQYSLHKRSFSQFKGEMALFLECQADIWGAELVGELLLKAITTNQALMSRRNGQEISQFADEYLDKFFDRIIAVGARSATVAGRTHPTPAQRGLAAKRGLIMGLIVPVEVAMSYAASMNVYVSPREMAATDSIVRRYAKSVDYQPGSNFLIWSHEAARRIVHAPRRNCPYIVVSEEKIQWNTQNPPARYSFKVTNRGPKRLRSNLDAAMVLADRQDPDNTLMWDFVDIAHHQLDLDPGQSYEVFGTLNWEATTSRMPRMLLPTDPDASYNVVSADDPAAAADTVVAPSLGESAPSALGKMDSQLILNFIVDMVRFSDRYQQVRVGIGKMGVTNRIRYASAFYCPLTTRPIVSEGDGKYNLFFSLSEQYSLQEAVTLLEQLRQELAATYANRKVTLDEDKRGLTLSAANAPGLALSLSLEEVEGQPGQFTIDCYIFQKKQPKPKSD